MKDDRILLQTRIVLIVVVPFLLLAFLILYFFPDLSGQRFAWEIKPHMTALFIGSGYLGGAYMFIFAIFGRRWHRVAGAFPPVISFTISMLLATFLHWEIFDIQHFPFQLWLVLYIVTPFLVYYLWNRNRITDPVKSDQDDILVPNLVRRAFLIFGLTAFAWAIFMFILPNTAISIWPWKLSPLTARIMGGWFSLLGMGGIYTSRDNRWSAWRIPLQSITLWAVLVLAGAFFNPDDFSGGVLNSFTIGTGLSIILLVVFQVWMGVKQTKSVR